MKNLIKSSTILLSAAVLLLCTFNACIKGKGEIIEETLTVEPFTGVELRSSYDVVVMLGSQQSVIAKGQQNIIDRIITKVNSDGVLELDLEQGNYKEYELKVYVTVPIATYFAIVGSGDMSVTMGENMIFDNLTLKITGSGDLSGVGEFNITDATTATISGSGDMNFDLETGQLVSEITGSGNMFFKIISNEINATITGSGDLNCYGLSPTQNILVNGSGDYKGFFVDSQNTTAEITGSGDIECRVNTTLNATISGSGNIYYKGSPVVNSTLTGTGEILDFN